MNIGVPGVGNIVILEAWVKPSGPNADALKLSLDNTNEDTCFSVRALTKDTLENGRTIKRVIDIVTWDWVSNPGIRKASTFSKLSSESADMLSIDIDDYLEADGDIKPCVNCSIESNDVRESIKTLSSEVAGNTDILDEWL